MTRRACWKFQLDATDLLDHWQDPRLPIVVSISSNAQIDLLLKTIRTVRSHETEQRILRRLRHDVRSKD
jgi:hypothetical protein